MSSGTFTDILCKAQMEATAWLGHWYREVAENYAKARNCYKKVLAADPNNTVIGVRASMPCVPSNARVG